MVKYRQWLLKIENVLSMICKMCNVSSRDWLSVSMLTSEIGWVEVILVSSWSWNASANTQYTNNNACVDVWIFNVYAWWMLPSTIDKQWNDWV